MARLLVSLIPLVVLLLAGVRRPLRLILLTSLLATQATVALAEIDGWTTVDPMTGRVETGSRVTLPDGSQSYHWSGPYGQAPSSGYVSPPGLNGSRTYQSVSTDGSLGIGQIHPGPSSGEPAAPFFPTRPEPRGNVLPGMGGGAKP